MDVRMPDGVLVQNVPDGMTQDELMRRYSAKSASPESTGTDMSMFAPQEAIANLLTGAVAKTTGDVAGLASIPLHYMGWISKQPEEVRSKLIDAMTYQPRSSEGKLAAEYNPFALIGHAVSGIADAAQNSIAPEPNATGAAAQWQRALAQGTGEAVRQAPVFLPMAAKPVTNAVASGFRRGAESMMQRAIKPYAADLESGAAGRAVNTMLDEGINATRGGMEATQGRVSKLDSQVADILKSSPATVDPGAVVSHLSSPLGRFRNQVNPAADINAILKTGIDFLDSPTAQGPIPVALAHELKRGTYRAVGSKAYGEQGTAAVEGQKGLAHGLREEVANAAPEVRPLTATEAQLMNVLSVAENRVLVDANKNVAGLGMLAANPKAFAAWMADRSALFKSLVARMLNTTAEVTRASGNSPAPGILPSVYSSMYPAGYKKDSEQ